MLLGKLEFSGGICSSEVDKPAGKSYYSGTFLFCADGREESEIGKMLVSKLSVYTI